MSRTEATGIRTVLSERLLQFAADRALQTREFERRVAALPADSPARASMGATLSAAKAWEAGLLWVAWRLQPRSRIGA
ncbi:hypothetical protein [Nakamurella sp.]|uniref:hypothetical protein n=1 Tax=Nakamurella sp. TaxID=1869182 RepID=UPI003B3A83A5